MGTFDSVYKNKIRQLEEENRQLRKILREASATSPPPPTSPAAPPGQMFPEPIDPAGYSTDPDDNLPDWAYPLSSPRPSRFNPKPTWATPMAPRLPDRVRGRGFPWPGSGAYPQLPAYYD